MFSTVLVFPQKRKTHIPVTCESDPELNPYLKKPIFEHDPIDQDFSRPGYKNRNLVCPETHYEDKSDRMQFVLGRAEIIILTVVFYYKKRILTLKNLIFYFQLRKIGSISVYNYIYYIYRVISALREQNKLTESKIVTMETHLRNS